MIVELIVIEIAAGAWLLWTWQESENFAAERTRERKADGERQKSD